MTAPDPEVEAPVREHHDAGGCTWVAFNSRGERGICTTRECNGAKAIRRAVEAGITVGKRKAYDECETCGCTGVMTVDDWSKGDDGGAVDVTCGECNGTGVGSFGRMLADAKAEGAREAYEACAKIADEFPDANDPEPSALIAAEEIAAAIRARGGSR